MLILDASVCAAFFAGRLISGAVAAIWPRGVWK